MNSYRYLFAIILSVFSLSVWAETKIGVVSMEQIQSGPIYDELRTKFEAEFKTRVNDIQAKGMSIQKIQESLQRDRDVITDTERLKRERDLVRMQQDYQRVAQELQEDQARVHQEKMMEYDKLLKKAAAQVAKESKLDLIVPDQVAVYSSNSIDVTRKVLSKMTMNQKGDTDKAGKVG